jgi:hypothetical protein
MVARIVSCRVVSRYLRRVLHPIVAQVCEIATETNFEVRAVLRRGASLRAHSFGIYIYACVRACGAVQQVNPTRLEESEGPPGVVVDLAQNTQNVLFVAAQVLHALRTSIHYCPMYHIYLPPQSPKIPRPIDHPVPLVDDAPSIHSFIQCTTATATASQVDPGDLPGAGPRGVRQVPRCHHLRRGRYQPLPDHHHHQSPSSSPQAPV